MKFEYYNPSDKYNCVIRSISKSLNKPCEEVLCDLESIDKDFNSKVEVFENYILDHKYDIDNTYNNMLLKDINLNGNNIIFAHIDDWYHLICVIDNIIYDKGEYKDIENMNIIKIYKKR